MLTKWFARDMREWDSLPPTTLYGYYLMASYLYYVAHLPSPLTDHQYDYMCATLGQEWDNFNHRLKHLSSREAMTAGTGHQINIMDYPSGLMHTAEKWAYWYDTIRT